MSRAPQSESKPLSRRNLLAAGAGAAALTACGAGAQGPDEGAEPLASDEAGLTGGYQSGGYRYVYSDGLPDHPFGPFPRFGCPNPAWPQHNYFRMPLVPTYGALFKPIGMNLFGVARNGVPFDPAGPFWREDPATGWQFEVMSALGRYYLGLDANNGHVQPTGAFHYHGPCEALILGSRRAPGWPITLVGWAADGFPIYAQLPVWLVSAPPIRSSYRLKAGCRPAGSAGGRYDGTFVQDYAFVPGSGELDWANGRWGPTPEFPAGTYHYYLTREFPFIPRYHRGVPDPTFSHPFVNAPAGPLKGYTAPCT